MRAATLFFSLVSLSVILAEDASLKMAPTPPVDRRVILKISLIGERSEFHMGERIPIRLSFSSREKKRYQLNQAKYDRCGRMHYERFTVRPADGAVDPLKEYFNDSEFSLGGLTGFAFLASKAWTIDLNLNEWVRFTKPGEYQLKVSSNRVEMVDMRAQFGTSPITAVSNAITLKIRPEDPKWQKAVYDQALKTLNTISSAAQREEPEKSPTYQALETLRFLGTPEATRELAKRLRGESSGGLDFICYIGLIGSPHRMVARDALKEVLADPDHPIDDTFLDALKFVQADRATRSKAAADDEKKAVEEVILALPKKRDKALDVTLFEVLDRDWRIRNQQLIPPETVQKLTSQLLSRFDQLSPEHQARLLETRWEYIKSPALLPLLKRYAAGDTVKDADGSIFFSRQIVLSALKRWYELDPVGARPALIGEMARPTPRFNAREIGFLPDKMLPELDQKLSEHLQAAPGDHDYTFNLASLVARYASDAILPQVLEKLDPRIGTWACESQNSLLAYVLRVNPQLAKPRIEKAIAARGKNFTACNHSLLTDISKIHYDPVLESVAIHSLNDPDPEVTQAAARMLSQFGSPAAESALLKRYESWSRQWAGRESELNLSFVSKSFGDSTSMQHELGRTLARALVEGHGWLTDRSKLEQLSKMNNVRVIKDEIDRCTKSWDKPALRISLHRYSEGIGGSVAQYQFQTVELLQEKLVQFPSGTKFVISAYHDNDKPSVADIRGFLTAKGMTVLEEPIATPSPQSPQ